MFVLCLCLQGRLRHINDGANAPWKNRGEGFCRNLGGSVKVIHALPPKFLQVSDFKAKMHQIPFRLGLRPRPAGGAYSAPPDPLAGFKGAYF